MKIFVSFCEKSKKKKRKSEKQKKIFEFACFKWVKMCVVVALEGKGLEKIGMLDIRCAFPMLHNLIDGEAKSDQNRLTKFVAC